MGCIREGGSSAVPVLTREILALSFYHLSLGLCYSSLREVERMRPFNRVCFGCAMNIKGLGYPYERFAICIRPISPLLLFLLFLRCRDICLPKVIIGTGGSALVTQTRSDQFFPNPPFFSRLIWWTNYRCFWSPCSPLPGTKAQFGRFSGPVIPLLQNSVEKCTRALLRRDQQGLQFTNDELLLCTRRSDSGFVQCRIDDHNPVYSLYA